MSEEGATEAGLTPARARSTRNQILGWYLLLLAVALAGALLLQRSFLFSSVDAQIEGDLRHEAAQFNDYVAAQNDQAAENPNYDASIDRIFDRYLREGIDDTEPESDGPVGLPYGEGVVTYLGDSIPHVADSSAGELLNTTALRNAIIGIEETQAGEINTLNGPARYIAVPVMATDEATGEQVTAGVFVVGMFLDTRLGAVDQAFVTGATVVILVFILVSAIAWLVAGRTLRPLRQLQATAAEISETDLSRRIPEQGKDEVAALASTFNRMLDRLEQAFTTQRRFIDDAGHELRTPITIIRGHLELLGDDPVEREQTVEIVTAELDRMSRIVDDLLMLARAEQPDFVVTAPMDVEDFVTDLMSKAWALAPHHEWSVDETIPAVVSADSQRLTQAMVNLIRNARAAPGPPSVLVSAPMGCTSGSAMKVAASPTKTSSTSSNGSGVDHGPGVDRPAPASVSRSWQPSRRGTVVRSSWSPATTAPRSRWSCRTPLSVTSSR